MKILICLITGGTREATQTGISFEFITYSKGGNC